MMSWPIYISPVQRNRNWFSFSRAKNAMVRKVLRHTHFMEAPYLLQIPVKPQHLEKEESPSAFISLLDIWTFKLPLGEASLWLCILQHRYSWRLCHSRPVVPTWTQWKFSGNPGQALWGLLRHKEVPKKKLIPKSVAAKNYIEPWTHRISWAGEDPQG